MRKLLCLLQRRGRRKREGEKERKKAARKKVRRAGWRGFRCSALKEDCGEARKKSSKKRRGGQDSAGGTGNRAKQRNKRLSRRNNKNKKSIYLYFPQGDLFSGLSCEEIPKSKGVCSVNTRYRCIAQSNRAEGKTPKENGTDDTNSIPCFPLPFLLFFFVKILLVPSRFCSFLSLEFSAFGLPGVRNLFAGENAGRVLPVLHYFVCLVDGGWGACVWFFLSLAYISSTSWRSSFVLFSHTHEPALE